MSDRHIQDLLDDVWGFEGPPVPLEPFTEVVGEYRISGHRSVASMEEFGQKPDLMFVGPRAYRMLTWETQGRLKWEGRDRRRIKRERRRYLASATD